MKSFVAASLFALVRADTVAPSCPGSVEADDSSVSCNAYCTDTGFAAGQMMDSSTCRCRSIIPASSSCAANAVDHYAMGDQTLCYFDSCSISAFCPASVEADDSSVSCNAYCKHTDFAAGQMMDSSTCRCRSIIPASSSCAANVADRYAMGDQTICYYDSCSIAPSSSCPASVEADDSSVSCNAYCKHSDFAAGQMMDSSTCRCRSIIPASSSCAANVADQYAMGDQTICYYDSCSIDGPKTGQFAIMTAQQYQPEKPGPVVPGVIGFAIGAAVVTSVVAMNKKRNSADLYTPLAEDTA